MKNKYNLLNSGLTVISLLFVGTVSAQCPAISCQGNITTNASNGNCGAVVSFTPPVGTNPCAVGTQTFNYTGSLQTFTVPAGVTSLAIEARGAQGGGDNGTTGGLGAKMSGLFTVTPGQVLTILVGKKGDNGDASLEYSGGGGGTFVVAAGNIPLVVAGGGGGTNGNPLNGNQNAPVGNSGLDGFSSAVPSNFGLGGSSGNGATNNPGGPCAGNGGGFNTDGQEPNCAPGNTRGKAFVNLGAGGVSTCGNAIRGGYGGGGGGGCHGAGGGGGYSGGGANYHFPGNGGGGGSFNSGTNQVNTAGFQAGDGQVIVAYNIIPTTTLIAGLAPGSTFPVGTTTETYRVTDQLGNTAQCSFTITVVDNQNPIIATNTNITVNNDPGVCGAVVTFTAPTATDNCSAIVTQGGGLASGATFPIGITTETFVATDPAGHTATSSFTVTVTDNESPVITAPANIASCLPVINNIAPIGFSDNCSAFVTYTITGSTTGFGNNDASGTTFNLGVSTVTYKATDPAGNFSTASFNVTINPSYNIPKSVAICQGNSYFVGGAFQNTPGTYIDMLQTTKGCDSIITTQLVIDPAPAVTLSPFHVNSVCVDAGLISVPAGSPLGGTYSGNGVVILYSFDPGQAGVGTHWIYYTVANASGCTGKDSTQITVTPCTGIAESNEIPNIDVYPNPTNGQVTITLGNNQKSIEVTVMELNGSIVRTESYRNTNLVKTDISGLSSGMYFMRVKADDKISTVKIMKN